MIFRLDAPTGSSSPARRDALGCDEVAIWYRSTDRLSASDLTALDAALSDEERARRDGFVFARDRRDFTAAHALLRQALCCYGHLPATAWQFERNAYGKPALASTQAAATQLTFNLSHTSGIVACAITRRRCVGIDVEQCGALTDAIDIAAHYFSAAECATLSACAADEVNTRFIELWTLKEAYLKAVGVGLSLPLNSFGFVLEGESGIRFSYLDNASRWQFWLASVHRARVAVAVGAEDAPRRISFHCASGDGPPVKILRVTAPARS